MRNRSTIVAIVAVALLIAGIAFAVSRLYETPAQEESATGPSADNWDILRGVPSDAVAVLVFDGSAKASRILADSTGILEGIMAPGNKAFMTLLQALGRRETAVSLHNSGSLVPLVAAKVTPADSLLERLADAAGLKTRRKDNFFFASRSETFLGSGVRHLEEGISLLGNRSLQQLVQEISGPAIMLISHSHAAKLLQVYAGKQYRNTSFVKDLTLWSAWNLKDLGADEIALRGVALPGEAAGSFFKAFAGMQASAPEFPETVPYYTSSAISIPIKDAKAFIGFRRAYEDGQGRLSSFDRELKAKKGRAMSPAQWFESLSPREIVKISFRDGDAEREAVLVKSSQGGKASAHCKNEYAGCMALVCGEQFNVADSVSASLGGKWTAFGDLAAVSALQDQAIKEYSLKNRLADASVSLPAGIVTYASLTDDPELPSRILAGSLSAPVKDFFTGAGFAPAAVSIDLSGAYPVMGINISKRALKGSNVQVMERDTVVVVPAGLFPVTNFQTEKTNYLYQNRHLSICLRDENGKDVWGIPFKEAMCGRVKDIDYYNNKKIQFLFAAGDKLYAIDRLGHWVNGFPVKLPSAVKLGPDVYDFTGAGGYTVMVLHKDNRLERYNLHGQKPAGWNGISAPETVKDLPELLETGGKKYWIVRTSIRTLVYPFAGGEALVKEDGGKMIRPDAQIKLTSKGISAECYDGKSRDFKLQ